MKKIFAYILLLLCGTACTKDALLQYKGGNSIYSYIQGYWIYVYDITTVNFSRDTAQPKLLPLGFTIVGQLSPEKRAFKLVVSDSSTAIANQHYTLPPADSFYIPADTIGTSIPILIHRTPDLYEKSVVLILKLQPNENFTTNMPEYTPEYLDRRSGLTLRITISDILEQPDSWEGNKTTLGIYTRKKLTLMVKTLSLDLDRFYDDPYSSTQLKNLARDFQAYLNQQKKQGNIVKEEDGTEMIMGPDVQ